MLSPFALTAKPKLKLFGIRAYQVFSAGVFSISVRIADPFLECHTEKVFGWVDLKSLR